MLEIATFGRISVGKSALLNAVFGTDVFTVDVKGGSTTAAHPHEVDFAGRRVTLIDTPGIGEVNGGTHTEAARQAAGKADLVLVVLDHDVTNFEFDEIEALAEAGKPLVVILNKADTLGEEARGTLLAHIRGRLAAFVDEHNVLVCAADPLRYYARQNADGTLDEWAEHSQPEVNQVRHRLARILDEEQTQLQEIDQALSQVHKTEVDIAATQAKALVMVDDYAVGVGLGVALNPIPLLDLCGGAAIAMLIPKLADCYGMSITAKEVRELSMGFVQGGWKQLLGPAASILGGAALKFVPFLGHLAGMITQGVGAYYVTYVIGSTCSVYFVQNKQWTGSLEETLQQIIASTDRKSLSRRAAERIKAKLKTVKA